MEQSWPAKSNFVQFRIEKISRQETFFPSKKLPHMLPVLIQVIMFKLLIMRDPWMRLLIREPGVFRDSVWSLPPLKYTAVSSRNQHVSVPAVVHPPATVTTGASVLFSQHEKRFTAQAATNEALTAEMSSIKAMMSSQSTLLQQLISQSAPAA